MDEQEMRDQLAAAAAGMDQLAAFGRDLAGNVAQYFNVLIASGCERDEALTLTANYQHNLFAFLTTIAQQGQPE